MSFWACTNSITRLSTFIELLLCYFKHNLIPSYYNNPFIVSLHIYIIYEQKYLLFYIKIIIVRLFSSKITILKGKLHIPDNFRKRSKRQKINCIIINPKILLHIIMQLKFCYFLGIFGKGENCNNVFFWACTNSIISLGVWIMLPFWNFMLNLDP